MPTAEVETIVIDGVTIKLDQLTLLNVRRTQADAYAQEHGIDQWGMRVAWFIVSEGPKFARAVCSRYNKQSNAWKAYQRLLTEGFIDEKTDKFVYGAHPDWEGEENSLRWIEAVAAVASGQGRHPNLILK